MIGLLIKLANIRGSDGSRYVTQAPNLGKIYNSACPSTLLELANIFVYVAWRTNQDMMTRLVDDKSVEIHVCVVANF
jgi:hypothetical protein